MVQLCLEQARGRQPGSSESKDKRGGVEVVNAPG